MQVFRDKTTRWRFLPKTAGMTLFFRQISELPYRSKRIGLPAVGDDRTILLLWKV